jgi:predicted nucleotidyltransferase
LKVVGLITEYNPFHNGHLYHFTKAKEQAEADFTLCVMSGSFLQRGEPALVNKWARTQMALEAGIDLVLEIPVAYATSSAQAFAEGAVRMLEASGVVTHLCFGSELGSLEPLTQVASLVLEEPEDLRELIRKYLALGLVYPKARSEALSDYFALQLPPNQANQVSWDELVKSPNNILGIEYLRGLQLLDSSIQPLTVERLHSGYNEVKLRHSSIASATSIRHNLRDKGKLSQDLKAYLPVSSWRILSREFQAGRGPVFPEQLCPHLLMKLRTSIPDALVDIPDVSEGLEYRIWEAAQEATSFYSLVGNIKTKRYTWTRIQRILLHFLLGYTKTMSERFKAAGGPQYLRVLGFTDRGRILLKEMRERSRLPVVTKVNPVLKTPGPAAEMLALDIVATNVHSLLYPAGAQRKSGQDYKYPPIYYSN